MMRIEKIIIRTSLLLILFASIYLIIFILPNLLFRKELSKAVKIIYPKYLYLSKVRSYQTGYISLKSESMQFLTDKNTYLSKIDESSESLKKEIKKPYRKGLLIFPKKKVSINLDYIQKTDNDLTIRIEDALLKQSSELEKIKKINSALEDLYAYDMGVDFGGFNENSDSDREVILQRVSAAKEGLSKVSDKLAALGVGYRPLSSEIKKLSDDFLQMEKYLQNSDYKAYRTLFNKTLESYEDIRKSAFLLEIDVFKENTYLEILSNEKDILQKYEGILQKINEMQSGE